MKKLIGLSICLFCVLLSYSQWKSGGTLLSTPNQNNFHTIVTSTPKHGAFVSWVSSSGTSDFGDIYLNGIDSDGNILSGWGAGGRKVNQPGMFMAPVVVASEDDGAIVSWYGIPTDSVRNHIYLQKFSRNGVPLWNGGNPVQVPSKGVDNYRYQMLKSDKHNGVYLTWTRYDTLMSAGSLDIYLIHIDSTGEVAKGWNPDGTAVANTPDVREYYPRLVLSNDQQAVYVLYTKGPILDASVILKKFNASDGKIAAGWLDSGLVISPGPQVYTSVMYEQWLFADKFNNVAVFWIETRSSSWGEIYMQRVSSEGSFLLKPEGKLINGLAPPEGCSYMEIAQDESGSYLVTDNYYYSDLSNEVDATMVSYSGYVYWQKCPLTKGHVSFLSKPASDGNKGMYVFYERNVSGYRHLYAIALDSSGNYKNIFGNVGTDFGIIGAWDPYNAYYDFDVVAGRNGQAIVMWDKKDGNFYNIYTCNILSDGTNCSLKPSDVSESLNISDEIRVYPNPFNNIINVKLEVGSRKSEVAFYFKVYDMTGRLMLEQEIKTNQEVISTASLSKGMYFYSIKSDDKVVKRGLIVRE